MVSAIYMSLSALLIVKLSLSVVALRRKNKIRIGDGGNEELLLAIRAQANATEYIPISLLLLLALELNGAPKLLIHALGIALITGRILHAMAIPGNNLKLRVLGMQITIVLLIGLAVLNIAFLPFSKLM